jgi:hypothetical protein
MFDIEVEPHPSGPGNSTRLPSCLAARALAQGWLAPRTARYTAGRTAGLRFGARAMAGAMEDPRR